MKKVRNQLKEYAVIQQNVESVLGIKFSGSDQNRDNTIDGENRNAAKNEIDKT